MFLFGARHSISLLWCDLSKISTIAIDGPVASGKTTVGMALSKELGYNFVDTGLMYRAVTWMSLFTGADLDNEKLVTEISRNINIDVKMDNQSKESKIIVNGSDVTDQLRKRDVEAGVSIISGFSGVRSSMVDQQRKLASSGNIVMVGRDIGTVVVPDADLKIFLTASIEERSNRRHLEKTLAGELISLHQVREDTRRRDELDSGRSDSPLAIGSDAYVLETDDKDLGQVVQDIIHLIENT